MSGTNDTWLEPPDEPVLPDEEVHAWLAGLDWNPQDVGGARRLLSEDELERSRRFVFSKDARHFIAARGLLRSILGQYLRTPASQLKFCYNRYGKPALDTSTGAGGVQFNVSHSQGKALIAVTRSRRVGVDIEYVRQNPERMALAGRFFSPREAAALRSLPESQQEQAFYRCWTRKEAYIKAAGKGLSLPLEQFDVSLAPGDPPALLRNDIDPAETSRWLFYPLPPISGWEAALAAEGEALELKCWKWAEGWKLPG